VNLRPALCVEEWRPVEVAAAVAAILGPYLARAGLPIADFAGETAVDSMKALYRAVRRRFDADSDPSARQSLSAFEEKPEDATRQEALVRALAHEVEADPQFAAELGRLVEDTTKGEPVSKFMTQVFGGEVGQIFNIEKLERLELN
jgi:hypothetical protein